MNIRFRVPSDRHMFSVEVIHLIGGQLYVCARHLVPRSSEVCFVARKCFRHDRIEGMI